MGLLTRRRSPESMKRLYNWFCRFYPGIELALEPMLEVVARTKIARLRDVAQLTALDYACGTGLWTLKLAPFFKSVTGVDQSLGMLSRARLRAQTAGLSVEFREGNLLEIREPEASVDWVFLSFALHLFPVEMGTQILQRLLGVARQGVMVVDHSRRRDLPTAFVEWLEGSWYDQFIKTDFAPVAARIGAATFEEEAIGDCTVLVFRKHPA